MSELRRDPVIGQWVIVHTDKSLRPDQYEKEDQTPVHEATCQFCPGREHQTPPEVGAIRPKGAQANGRDWQVRVVPNKFPALKIEGDIDPSTRGIFDVLNGVGAHEVVIETPVHGRNFADYSMEETNNILRQYQHRINDLTGDKRFKYIIVFKNYGESAGTSVEHAHSQIIALPMIPKYVAEEISGAEEYYKQHQRCVYCDMIGQEQKDKERIIFEADHFIAFCPYVSRYTFECWIAPKHHDSYFVSLNRQELSGLSEAIKEVLSRLKGCLADPSYNFYLHNAPVNSGKYSSFHWHLEIVPKLTRTTGFEWGTGFYVVRTSPEAAAKYLRETAVAAAA